MSETEERIRTVAKEYLRRAGNFKGRGNIKLLKQIMEKHGIGKLRIEVVAYLRNNHGLFTEPINFSRFEFVEPIKLTGDKSMKKRGKPRIPKIVKIVKPVQLSTQIKPESPSKKLLDPAIIASRDYLEKVGKTADHSKLEEMATKHGAPKNSLQKILGMHGIFFHRKK